MREEKRQLRKKEEQLREKEIILLKKNFQAKDQKDEEKGEDEEEGEDGDKLAPEDELPPKKKRIDSSFDFAPKITWNEMVKLNLLPDIATFLRQLQSVWCCEDFGLDETDDIVQVNKFIAENSVAMNEGYPMLVCGNMIAYFTAKLLYMSHCVRHPYRP